MWPAAESLLALPRTLLADGSRLYSLDTVLSPYVYVFYTAFIVSFIFTPVMRSVAVYYGIVDRPDGVRKMHREPVAYLGGVAVFLGWIAGLAISQFLFRHEVVGIPGRAPVVVQFSLVLGALLIVLVGLFDDIRGVRPYTKIGIQVLAAVTLLMQGIGTRAAKPLLDVLANRINLWIYGPVGTGANLFPDWFIYACSALIVVALVVFCCNATNLMDGLDGLCGGVTGIIALGYLILAIHLAMTSGLTVDEANRNALRIILGLALLGGVLGFVPYNFNPASIFMGDTGSMFLGYAIAAQMALLAEAQSKWFLAAMVMFALPVLDTSLAFVRRYVNGRPFFSADKHHIHHQFMARGLSVKQTVLFLYGAAVIFLILGSSIVFMRTRYAVAIYLVVFCCIIVAAYKMGMIHEKVRVVERKPIGPGDTVSNQTDDTDDVIEIADRPAGGQIAAPLDAPAKARAAHPPTPANHQTPVQPAAKPVAQGVEVV